MMKQALDSVLQPTDSCSSLCQYLKHPPCYCHRKCLFKYKICIPSFIIAVGSILRCGSYQNDFDPSVDIEERMQMQIHSVEGCF